MKNIDPRFAGSIIESDRMVVEASVWTLAYGPTTFRFVNLDHGIDLNVEDGAGSKHFEPMPFQRSEISTQADLQIDRMSLLLPNLELLVEWSSDSSRCFLSDLVLNGVLDRASLWLYLVNLRNLSSYRHSQWDVIGASDINSDSLSLELESAMGRTVKRSPRTIIQEQCNNQLYDPFCVYGQVFMTRVNYVTTGAALAGDKLYMNTALAAADNYYDLGQVQFISGRNVGASRTVGKHLNAGGLVTWNVPLRYEVVAGDRFEIVPGCNKTTSACSTKFLVDNLNNWRGFCNVPKPEVMM